MGNKKQKGIKGISKCVHTQQEAN